MILRPVEPLAIDFPLARTVVGIRSERTVKSTGVTTKKWRYYLSSQEPDERALENWIGLIRGHSGGVENRNHWRRDALWGEDQTRSRNAQLVANLALVRSALFRLSDHRYPDRSHSEMREALAGLIQQWPKQTPFGVVVCVNETTTNEPRTEAHQTVRVVIEHRGGRRSMQIGFTDQCLSAHGGLALWANFLTQVGWRAVLRGHLPHRPTSPNAYDPTDTALGLMGGSSPGRTSSAGRPTWGATRRWRRCWGLRRSPASPRSRASWGASARGVWKR